MRRVFFIDYENVDTAGLDGLSRLTSQDEIYIYYSEKHSRMTFGLHRRICESNAKFMYRKIKDKTKNALDNTLMDEAKDIINDPKSDYYIISKDKGYQNFIKKELIQGFKVNMYTDIKESNQVKKDEIKNKVKSRLENNYDLTEDDIDRIAYMIMNSDNKSELNVNLQKMFHNKDVKYIFTRIRDITYCM